MRFLLIKHHDCSSIPYNTHPCLNIHIPSYEKQTLPLCRQLATWVKTRTRGGGLERGRGREEGACQEGVAQQIMAQTSGQTRRTPPPAADGTVDDDVSETSTPDNRYERITPRRVSQTSALFINQQIAWDQGETTCPIFFSHPIQSYGCIYPCIQLIRSYMHSINKFNNI